MGFGSVTRMYSVTITQVIEAQSLAKKLTLCKTQSVWILSYHPTVLGHNKSHVKCS